MDFDDLDEEEQALGPTFEEQRQALLEKQVPEKMEGAKKHPRPEGKGYGGGNMKYQKVLYLYGPGSNAKMSERQVSALFKNVPWVVDFKIFEWHYFEGEINNKVEEIHADPAVAALFIPYGSKCGSTYDGYLSYVYMNEESHNCETWMSPEGREKFMAGKYEELNAAEHGHGPVMDKLAKHLAETGPYDGICGFDMGGCLAFEAARLAQEGDERFVGKFRYLMLFSTRGHKEMAMLGQGQLRPKAPLQIPCFIGWSMEDDSKQYSHYEDMCLYIHPKYRGVFYHDQGHRPPNIQKNTTQCEQLDAFVGSMQADAKYAPAETAEVKMYRDYWLPINREPLPEVPGGTPCRVVVIPDPQGEHGPKPEESADRARFPAQEMQPTCAERLAAYRFVTGTTTGDVAGAFKGGPDVEIVEVSFDSEHKSAQWHPVAQARDVSQAYAAGQGRSRWLQVEDEVALPWSEVNNIARSLLDQIPTKRDDLVAVVGFGAGAHIALAMTKLMQDTRQLLPVRLWVVCPPTVWPLQDVPQMGHLCTTPVRYLTNPSSVAGPPWRYETSTFGQFSHSHFTTKDEMLKIIVDDVKGLLA